MADGELDTEEPVNNVLTKEQDAVLDLYLQSLDSFIEVFKESEQIQVEIETQHLKKILRK